MQREQNNQRARLKFSHPATVKQKLSSRTAHNSQSPGDDWWRGDRHSPEAEACACELTIIPHNAVQTTSSNRSDYDGAHCLYYWLSQVTARNQTTYITQRALKHVRRKRLQSMTAYHLLEDANIQQYSTAEGRQQTLSILKTRRAEELLALVVSTHAQAQKRKWVMTIHL